MSTTPITPAPISVNVMTPAAAQTWLQAHERLILVILAFVLVGWLGSKYFDHEASVDKQKATAAISLLDQQKTINDKTASATILAEDEYRDIVSRLSAQNAALANAVTQRSTVLMKQQATDQTLSNPQVATRWQAVEPILPKGSVTANENGVQVTTQGARDAVSDLEQIPVLQQNLKDSQSEFANQQTELDQSNQLVSTLNTQVTGLNTEIKDEQTACKAEVASAKATAKKGKLHWFEAGFITGFAAGAYIGHHI